MSGNIKETKEEIQFTRVIVDIIKALLSSKHYGDGNYDDIVGYCCLRYAQLSKKRERISLNMCVPSWRIDYLRRNGDFYRTSGNLRLKTVSLDIVGEINMPSYFKDPNKHRDLYNAVNKLKEPYKSYIVNHYVLGFTQREIAKKEGVVPATINNKINKGLNMLRKELENV